MVSVKDRIWVTVAAKGTGTLRVTVAHGYGFDQGHSQVYDEEIAV